jgi:membrane-associated phospholipid phosphatase
VTRARFFRSAFVSAALSLLFIVVYGGCNAFTASRTGVGTCALDWERYIPFIPLMIVPYMSIDAFFVVAPFICANDDERRRLAGRIIMAILVGGSCFLLFPLRFAFPRPEFHGPLGAVFDWFRAKDAPFNLAPSLHIALRTILVSVYVRHTRGLPRLASHVWFSLVGFSTLLVWQHHLLDVVTGFILAGYCFFVFPEPPSEPLDLLPNRRVGVYYTAGCALIAALATLLRPWGALLLWPAMALGILGAANFRLGAGVFRKRGGRIPLTTRLVLGPVLFGQWLSLRHYRRQCRRWDPVARNVWIGRVLTDREAAEAVAGGVAAVLDLTGEFSEARPFMAVRYRNMPVLDLTAPSPRLLREMSDFITAESAKGIVYVHCKIGYSRSAAAVGAWLLASGRSATADDAIALLRRSRPMIVVRPEVQSALAQFASEITGRNPSSP